MKKLALAIVAVVVVGLCGWQTHTFGPLDGNNTWTGTNSFTSIGLTGIITQYNNVATVANGIPQLVAKSDQLAQTGNIGPIALYTVPAGGVGTYRVNCYVVLTSAGTTSTMPQCGVSWVDSETGTSQGPIFFTQQTTNNTVGNSSVFAAGCCNNMGTATIQARAGAITFSTTSYASTGTPMQYAIHVKLEYLGN